MLLLTIELTQVCLIVFSSFALASLQNVTVDDAALTGAVVPKYMPSTSPPWNQGADCSGCFAKPDPAYAYDGTWHDTTFTPGNGVNQSIEITFVGSAVYIFFILANNVEYATTFTGVNFILDGTPVSTYMHNPSSSSAYQYNVPVYSNPSMNSGQHTLIVQPVSSEAVLILFDYLIYTVDTDQVTTTSTPPSTPTYPSSPISAYSDSPTEIYTVLPSPIYSGSSTSTYSGSSASIHSGSSAPIYSASSASIYSASPTPAYPGPPSSSTPPTMSTSSSPDNGAIIGGAVGGAAALAVGAALVLYYRRRKGRQLIPSSAVEASVIEPFISPAPITQPLIFVSTSVTKTRSSPESSASVSSARLDLPSIPSNSTSPPSGPSSGATALMEQVEILREEVAQLRHLRDQDGSDLDSSFTAPPRYSEA